MIIKRTVRGWLKRPGGGAIQVGDKIEGMQITRVEYPTGDWTKDLWTYWLSPEPVNFSWGEKLSSIYGDVVRTCWDCGCEHVSGNTKAKEKFRLCGEHDKLPKRFHRNVF